MTRLYCDGPTLIRAVSAAVVNLEQHVDEVDALNVFPVPDGDTGSNMLATMRAALAEAESLPEAERDLHGVADALSRGALTGARGNSGVILSQIIAGMTDGADGRRRASGMDLAQGLRRGSEVAYGSVLTPVEGTILTVIRDAAEAAETAAGRQPHVETVLADTIEAAARSVERTPSLLPVLEDAGVVDSGGQGLYRVLEGMLQVGLPDAAERSTPRLDGPAIGTSDAADDPHRGHDHADHGDHTEGTEHGYETQYMLTSLSGGIELASLRAAIEAVGDSVVVAGNKTRTRVHVHGERPDLAIGAGLPYGRLSQIEILDLDHQVADHLDSIASPKDAATPRIVVVAASAAPGVADALASFGALIVRPQDGSRPSVGEIAAAIEASGAEEAIVLPNDRDAVLAARLAPSLVSNVNVKVVPTRNGAEGVAAMLAFDPDSPIDVNASKMEAEVSAVRSFTVISAAKDAVVDGQQVAQGDIIALDAGRRMLATGADVVDTAIRALAQLDTFELVTVYRGDSNDTERDEALRTHIAAAGWGADVEIVEGGMPHDHLLVAVE